MQSINWVFGSWCGRPHGSARVRVLQRRLRELGQWPVAATALGVWAPALGVAASVLELPRRRAAARWDTQPNPGARPFVVAENGGGIPVRAIGYVSSAAGHAPTRRAVSGQIAAIDEACRRRGWELTE